MVTSSPSGIACGADCSESHVPGTSVILTAAPLAGSDFSGWGAHVPARANKLDVAAYYTAKVAAGCAYGTEQDGVNVLSGVTAISATVIAAKAAIDGRCAP